MLIDFIKQLVENPLLVKFGLAGLFFSSVLSSIFPLPVEIASSTLLLTGQSTNLVFIVMAVGSVLGGVISYVIGYDGSKIFNLLYKKQKRKHYEKSLTLLTKYGWGVILIAAWIPILGDIVTVIAGVKKYDFKKFAVAITLGKISHVFVIVYFSNLVFHYLNYF
jgi:membrane protein YqaA with SNARE-associated domain